MRRHFPALLHVFVLPLVAVGLCAAQWSIDHAPRILIRETGYANAIALWPSDAALPAIPTTTTAPPAPPRPKPRPTRGDAKPRVVAAPGPLPTNVAGQVNGYPCGGDLPPCWVLWRESKGNPTAVNPRGCSGRSCGGLWQFDPRTWAGFGGYARAELAPPDVQNAKARALWAGGRGCSHWAACGRRS